MSLWTCEDCGDFEYTHGISAEWPDICSACYKWSLTNGTVYVKPLTHAQQSAETFAQLPPASDDFWDL